MYKWYLPQTVHIYFLKPNILDCTLGYRWIKIGWFGGGEGGSIISLTNRYKGQTASLFTKGQQLRA